MHDWGIFIPIAAITVGPIAWAFNNWTRARHGFEPHRWGEHEQAETVAPARERELLRAENERLTGQVSRLEERIAVLERIATDPAERTARAIDALR
jgi:hypothetical protein